MKCVYSNWHDGNPPCCTHDCEGCVWNDDEEAENAKPPKQSNADRLRSMSDEELAEWVWGAETAGRAYGPRGKQAWLNWLKQEAT